MLINQVSKQTKLTKKAIEFYIEQGLVCPILLENGYRDFSPQMVDRLEKIALLRKLDLSVGEIKAMLADNRGNVLHGITLRRALSAQKEAVKQEILNKLSMGASFESIQQEVQGLERNFSIAQRLLDAFPGYYGRFVCLHFARFFADPIVTAEQQGAYETIVKFLDGLPPLVMPPDLQEYVEEYTHAFSTETVNTMMKSMEHSIAHPQEFLEENKEVLSQYLAYKQSEEYQSSPAARLQKLLQQFQETHDYTTVFIPAMKALSPSYAAYYRQMEQANRALLEEYPQIAQLQ